MAQIQHLFQFQAVFGSWYYETVLVPQSYILYLHHLASWRFVIFFGNKESELITVELDGTGNFEKVAPWKGNLQEGNVQEQGEILRNAEIHIVSSIRNQLSRFDQFTHEFRNIYACILGIQKNFTSSAAIATMDPYFEKQLKRLHMDLMYIQQNVEMLQSSRNYKSGEELLKELMEVVAQLSSTDSSTDLASLKQLIRFVVNLKLIVPPKEGNDQDASKITRKKNQSSITSIMNMENVSAENISNLECHHQERVNLLCAYESLNEIQRYCLLCFSTFPCNEVIDKNTGVMKSLVINKKILLFLWAGEGIIDPYCKENAALLDMKNQVSQDISTTKQSERANTIEDTGKQILTVLRDKGFIEPVIKKNQETGSCRMSHFVHSFVTAMAKELGFFYFSKQNGRHTPYFTRSRRDCSLQCRDSFPSSRKFQVKFKNSHKEAESLSDVLTLFNNKEAEVDIKPEWFSKMKHLYVLYLGSWCSKNANHIEVVDKKFLGSLKKMKQLRFLSLQGLSTIEKLPDSICKLRQLKILDLRECSYLEELPANIGLLKNLTHLDVTNCRFLTKLPKSICLLSKLEVLKGFMITHQTCDPQNQKVRILEQWWGMTKRSVIHGLFRIKNDEACTFRDLLKIEKLRELSLVVVNLYKFFDDEYLDVFKEMRSLRKLKILWETSIYSEKPSKEWDWSSESEYCTQPFRWQKLKCWERQPSQSDTEETSRINHLQNVEKLELWCLPHEAMPFWLDPEYMKNLKKLYIIGGSLETMPPFKGEWNVTTLRLKYLDNFDISWSDLNRSFPHLTYMECYQCKLPGGLPYNEDGVWRCEKEGHELVEESELV